MVESILLLYVKLKYSKTPMLCYALHVINIGIMLFARDVLSAIPFYLMNKLANCFINDVVFQIKVEVITLK